MEPGNALATTAVIGVVNVGAVFLGGALFPWEEEEGTTPRKPAGDDKLPDSDSSINIWPANNPRPKQTAMSSRDLDSKMISAPKPSEGLPTPILFFFGLFFIIRPWYYHGHKMVSVQTGVAPWASTQMPPTLQEHI
jgi:hypothetical protein